MRINDYLRIFTLLNGHLSLFISTQFIIGVKSDRTKMLLFKITDALHKSIVLSDSTRLKSRSLAPSATITVNRACN